MQIARSATWATHPVVATLIGIVAAGITVMLAERLGHVLFGTAAPDSPERISTAQYVSVLVAWMLGAAIGSLVATRWGRSRSVIPGTVVGVFILLGAIASFTAFAHPAWMMVASVALPLVGLGVARAARLDAA